TSYKGIEEGRDPKLVIREEAVSSARAMASAEAEEPETAVEPEERDNGPMPTKRASSRRAPSSPRADPAGGAALAAASGAAHRGPGDLPWAAEPDELERLASMPVE